MKILKESSQKLVIYETVQLKTCLNQLEYLITALESYNPSIDIKKFIDDYSVDFGSEST